MLTKLISKAGPMMRFIKVSANNISLLSLVGSVGI